MAINSTISGILRAYPCNNDVFYSITLHND